MHGPEGATINTLGFGSKSSVAHHIKSGAQGCVGGGDLEKNVKAHFTKGKMTNVCFRQTVKISSKGG